jgi:hypothetical protein
MEYLRANAARIDVSEPIMKKFVQNARFGMLASATSMIVIAVAFASGPPSTVIRKVSLLGSGKNVELEVAASGPVNPQAQLLANPNRLVLDFANASMASGVHGVTTPQGVVSGVRIGILTNNPPVTRVIVDLTAPQSYQLFPSGNSVIVKINSATGQPAAASTAFETQFEVVADEPLPQPVAPVAPPAPKVEVSYQGGLLSIAANTATLAEVLFEIQKKTGADIPIPAGAGGDQVFTKIGPVPPGAALASLLNGSNFNFIMVGSDETPSQLRSVLIFPKGGSPPQVANSTPQLTPRPPAPQEQPESEPAQEENPIAPNGGPVINPNTGLPEEPEQQPAPQ